MAAVAVLFLAACDGRAGTTERHSPHATATAPTVPSSSFLLRDYYGHGRSFHMDRDGYGLIEWRATHECFEVPPPTPCYGGDPNRPGGVAPIFIRSVSAVTATGWVLSSTEPAELEVGAIVLRWDKRMDVLTVLDRHGRGFTFCGPRNEGTCGL